MKEKLKNFAHKAKETISSTVVLVGDLNGDGKIDEEDAKIAAEWAKRNAKAAEKEIKKLGKEALRTDLVKDAASGAAIGAAVAIPVPVIGPMAGAAIGAGLGVYKNLTQKGGSTIQVQTSNEPPVDIHAELLKLDELKQKGIINEAEFEAQKKNLLG